MTITKAKTIAGALLDLGLFPDISLEGSQYVVSVTKRDGATTTQVQNLETAQGVTARVVRVEFI